MESEINELRSKLTSTKHVFYFWIVIFFVVMIAVLVFSIVYIANLGAAVLDVAESVNQSGNVQVSLERNNLLSADYLATVIPVLITLAGSLFAFLGMNRLKMFDERIDKNRIDILLEMGEKVKSEVALSLENQSEAILKKVENKQIIHSEKMNELAENLQKSNKETEDIITDFSAFVKNSEISIKQKAQDSINRFEELEKQFEKRYEWLRAPITEDHVDLNFTTVSGAHTLVEALRKNKADNYITLIISAVNRVITSSEINGSASDYHNLAAELAREDLYNEACNVLDKGLSLFNTNTDLLSDLVQYASHVCNTPAAEKAVSSLYDIDSMFWTWRCYEFLIDYHSSIGKLDDAYELSCEFIEKYPNDEHGYRCKAEIEQQLFRGKEGITKAIDTLKQAIDHNVNCPQCANALCEIMLSLGDYDAAIAYESRALMELAQEQPHINIAHVFFNRATAYDRKFMKNLIDDNVQKEYAEKAIADYQAALVFPELARISEEQAKQRILLLNSCTADDNADQAQNLLSIIKQLTRSDCDKNIFDDEEEENDKV